MKANIARSPKASSVRFFIWSYMTERGNRTRIISLRKARPKERKNYAENRQ